MKEKKKNENIFTKRGFFVTLVVIVGVMTVAVIMNLIISKNDSSIDEDTWRQAVNESNKVAEKDDGLTSVYTSSESAAVSSTALPTQNKKTDTDNADNSEDRTQNTADADEKQNNTSNSSQIVLVAPVKGTILKDYSSDELQYSETMNDWRVHTGIDISNEEGTDVSAAADGTVETVVKDGMLGTCITILHPDGTKTIYGNLREDSAVSEGTNVKAGEVIAKIGKTAALEILEEPHLHFEVIYQGKNVNPIDFLPNETYNSNTAENE